jgi:hypothetical protein
MSCHVALRHSGTRKYWRLVSCGRAVWLEVGGLHGSVLSDTVLAAREDSEGALGIFGLQPIYHFVRTHASDFFGSGNDDMTVQGVESNFNMRFRTPPDSFTIQYSGSTSTFTTKPFYYSVSADADKDSDGTISAPEGSPFQLNPYLPNWLYKRLGTVRAITVREVDLPNRRLAIFDPTSSFQLNDFAVTVNSARYPPPSPADTGFMEIRSYVGSAGRNHRTVRDPNVAADVLAKIRDAENGQ